MTIAILGTGACLPEHRVDNDQAGAAAGVDHEWILRKTGIRRRRWAPDGLANADLATEAARAALSRAGVPADRVGLIVVATSTPDQTQPPTAATVQHRLGATAAAAFDLNAVCSGFVFALATAARMIAGTGGYALVIGADIYSRILDHTDRRTVVLFGDGAGAALLGPAPAPGRGLIATRLHTFGEHRDLIEVPPGGHFTMQGRAVREFVTGRVPGLVRDFLDEARVPAASVRHIVAHQANGVMLDELISALDLPGAVAHRTVETLGNTGAASVPITLDSADRRGLLGPGDRTLLVAFGGGMAVGLALLDR
ncbi:ketoacyl-ACP synthase III [Actinoplanes sp. NEAU-A12]|uniref:Ketoacyl-ACP synthase III n=1 Tax=Actinoplanes sandaracinus TaxID=3045177 RepID=A0ABT6WL10_9ACTN|nr:ketoacyl-ACP synthase III [Actinoplanes sandaracinus]MDI6100398.1 ketoacyl-ACP synthase III [Actinoplanes sandaracinus]